MRSEEKLKIIINQRDINPREKLKEKINNSDIFIFWRKRAFHVFPDLANVCIENIQQLWIDILILMETASVQRDTATVDDILEFAVKFECEIQSAPDRDEMFTALCCCFYEHIPQLPLARQEIRNFFSREKIFQFRHVFLYHGTEEQFVEMLWNGKGNDLIYQSVFHKKTGDIKKYIGSYTPIHDEGILFYISEYAPEFMKNAIRAYGVSINEVDYDGNSVLMRAAQSDNTSQVAMFFALGGDHCIRNHDGLNWLEIAKASHCTNFIDYIARMFPKQFKATELACISKDK